MEICEINSGKDEILCERYILCHFCLSLSPHPSSAILSPETHKPKYGKFCELYLYNEKKFRGRKGYKSMD